MGSSSESIRVELVGGPCDGHRDTIFSHIGYYQKQLYGYNDWYGYERTDSVTSDGRAIFRFDKKIESNK